MDDNTERLGICFCISSSPLTINTSPGLGLLLKGSTFKSNMRRKAFEALPIVSVSNQTCRIVRCRNKTIALFEPVGTGTGFARACSLLSSLGGEEGNGPRKISVDAMVAGYEKGEVRDYMGAIKASEHHEVVVYEDRGQDLSFLKPCRPCTPAASNPAELSGSERYQMRVALAEVEAREEREVRERKDSLEKRSKLLAFTGALSTAILDIPVTIRRKMDRLRETEGRASAVEEFVRPNPKEKPEKSRNIRTKADKGLVEPPSLREATEPLDHIINAFLEFKAVTVATKVVNTKTCKSILQTYRREDEGLLEVMLEEANAAVYDNGSSQVLKGELLGQYMAAYSDTGGFVALDEEETERKGRLTFKTPPNDPIVVIAKCTKIVLDDRILEMVEKVSGSPAFVHWTVPKITWVNGVPGCGKTTWIIRNIDLSRDLVITTTTQAAEDLREKLALRNKADVQRKVRTMASILVNGLKEPESCSRLIVDEALMNHFGAIVMAVRVTGASEALLVGDNNQLPYIDRNSLFRLAYNRPNLVANIDRELLCTHRNPMDVAYALNEIYSGIYSSATRVRSLTLKEYTGARIPKSESTLYLVHTQAEKELLIGEGYGEGKGSRVLTIHEAQGLTYERVMIVRTATEQLQLHGSVPHAVVAISRHTGECVYYTDSCVGDAIARFVRKAETATTSRIRDYNLKMAMRSRDSVVMEKLLEEKRCEDGRWCDEAGVQV